MKESGGHLVSHPLGGAQGDSYSIVDIAGRSGALVVDCSASEATLPGLLYALDCGYKVVLANKKPLTVDQDAYDALARPGDLAESTRPHRHLGGARWEATVGAGLPVNAMLGRLVVQRRRGAAHHRHVQRHAGLRHERPTAWPPFSEIVTEAYEQGYTEPDPRDDLNGLDVARKALILARGLGWQLELTDVAGCRVFIPRAWMRSACRNFWRNCPRWTRGSVSRWRRGCAGDDVLRFAATVADGQCSAGPVTVPKESPWAG